VLKPSPVSRMASKYLPTCCERDNSASPAPLCLRTLLSASSAIRIKHRATSSVGASRASSYLKLTESPARSKRRQTSRKANSSPRCCSLEECSRCDKLCRSVTSASSYSLRCLRDRGGICTPAPCLCSAWISEVTRDNLWPMSSCSSRAMFRRSSSCESMTREASA
jgi:hypothetical protein